MVSIILTSRNWILDIKKRGYFKYKEFEFSITNIPFLDVENLNANVWYQEMDFFISRNGISDIKKWNFWYQELDFFKSKIRTLDVKKSVFLISGNDIKDHFRMRYANTH